MDTKQWSRNQEHGRITAECAQKRKKRRYATPSSRHMPISEPEAISCSMCGARRAAVPKNTKQNTTEVQTQDTIRIAMRQDTAIRVPRLSDMDGPASSLREQRVSGQPHRTWPYALALFQDMLS
jgi:hypothetical protein